VNTLLDVLGIVLVLVGMPFFLAGTVGLLRFPDALSRLHALTKADSVGLGFVAVGLALQADSLLAAMKPLLVWLLVLVSGAVVSSLIAAHAVRSAPRNPAR